MDMDTHHAVKVLAELERRTVAQWLRLVVEDSVMSELTSRGTSIQGIKNKVGPELRKELGLDP